MKRVIYNLPILFHTHMRKIYLTISITCLVFVVVVAFQNLILNQLAWMFTIMTSSSIIIFLCTIAAFISGVFFILFYQSKRVEENADEQESTL